jgi:pilus assembly protein CpaB
MRAMAIRVDSIMGADYVSPGMRVHIIRKDLSPNGSKLDDSRIILENIRILAVGENVEQNSEGQPHKVSVVTLLITPEQGQKLALTGLDRFQLEVRN